MRGAWIEMLVNGGYNVAAMSLPMRGAWIEINDSGNADYTSVVAPHAGSVD